MTQLRWYDIFGLTWDWLGMNWAKVGSRHWHYIRMRHVVTRWWMVILLGRHNMFLNICTHQAKWSFVGWFPHKWYYNPKEQITDQHLLDMQCICTPCHTAKISIHRLMNLIDSEELVIAPVIYYVRYKTCKFGCLDFKLSFCLFINLLLFVFLCVCFWKNLVCRCIW